MLGLSYTKTEVFTFAVALSQKRAFPPLIFTWLFKH